jgi:hypothetical protein
LARKRHSTGTTMSSLEVVHNPSPQERLAAKAEEASWM